MIETRLLRVSFGRRQPPSPYASIALTEQQTADLVAIFCDGLRWLTLGETYKIDGILRERRSGSARSPQTACGLLTSVSNVDEALDYRLDAADAHIDQMSRPTACRIPPPAVAPAGRRT